MDVRTLLRIYAGFARQEISRHFMRNSCVASTAISLDVLHHYGIPARPWEVCLQVDDLRHHIDLGCSPPAGPDEIGGHLVAIVDDAFLLDASLGQLKDAHPTLDLPPAFVGELLPAGAPFRPFYEFTIRQTHLRYRERPIDRNYRSLPDWGPSPERDETVARILPQLNAYAAQHGLQLPQAAAPQRVATGWALRAPLSASLLNAPVQRQPSWPPTTTRRVPLNPVLLGGKGRILSAFETKVVSHLAANALSPAQLEAVICEGELVSLERTGTGYSLTLKHPVLMMASLTGSPPTVEGHAKGLGCRFAISIENGKLTMDCHTLGTAALPADFRENQIHMILTQPSGTANGGKPRR